MAALQPFLYLRNRRNWIAVRWSSSSARDRRGAYSEAGPRCKATSHCINSHRVHSLPTPSLPHVSPQSILWFFAISNIRIAQPRSRRSGCSLGRQYGSNVSGASADSMNNTIRKLFFIPPPIAASEGRTRRQRQERIARGRVRI